MTLMPYLFHLPLLQSAPAVNLDYHMESIYKYRSPKITSKIEKPCKSEKGTEGKCHYEAEQIGKPAYKNDAEQGFSTDGRR
jgi:hypothetical protein